MRGKLDVALGLSNMTKTDFQRDSKRRENGKKGKKGDTKRLRITGNSELRAPRCPQAAGLRGETLQRTFQIWKCNEDSH
jgi:hypothetical protein